MCHDENLAKVIELQDIIDKQNKEQTQMKERLTSLSSRVAELEEDLDTARKDLIKSEEMNTKLQRDVREVSNKLSNLGSHKGIYFIKFVITQLHLDVLCFFQIFDLKIEECWGGWN